MKSRLLFVRAAFVLAVLATTGPAARAQTWTGAAGSGNWNAAGNWIPSGVPTSSTSTAIVLDGTVQTTTTQNIVNPFLLNTLTMESDATAGFVVNGGGLSFGGSGPQIISNAPALLRFNNPVAFTSTSLLDMNANVTTGVEIAFYGALSGSGGVTTSNTSGGVTPGILIASANNTGYSGTVTNGANGGVFLGAVNAVFRTTSVNTGTLATGTTLAGTTTAAGIGINEAGFNQQIGGLSGGGGFQLASNNSTATVLAGYGNVSTTLTGPLAAPNSGSQFAKVGAGTLTYSGTTTNYNGGLSVRDGTFTIQGTSTTGRLSNTVAGAGSFDVLAGGTLRVNNGAGSLQQNRIGDFSPIRMAGGTLQLDGHTTNAGSEALLSLNLVTGQSTVVVNPTAGNGARFNFEDAASFTPGTAGGTVFFRGNNLGTANYNGNANTANIRFTTPATLGLVGGGGANGTTTMSIAPWGVGSATNATTPDTFVTYDTVNNSIRPLTNAEYSTFAAAGSTSNVSDGGFTIVAGTTLNALRNTGNVAINLNANLDLTSGALMAGGGSFTGAGSLRFGTAGAATAFVTATADTTLGTAVVATNFSKNGPAVLTVANSVTLGNNAVIAANAGTLRLAPGATFAGASGDLIYQVSRGATIDSTGGVGLSLGTNQTLRGNGSALLPITLLTAGTVAPSSLAGPAANNLASPGTLTVGNMTWQPGATYRWYVASAFEGPYTNSLITSSGTLDLGGLNAANRFTVRIDSLDLSNADGAVYDFDPSAGYSWTIATFNGGITGFAANKFTLNTTDFANAFDGTFSISLIGNSLVLTYAPVPEPGLLLGVTAAALAGWRLRRRRAA